MLNESFKAEVAASAWLLANKQLRIERNEVSRLHKLKEQMKDRRYRINGIHEEVDLFETLCHSQAFVVKHDWGGALSGSDGLSGDIRLPYKYCCFEFRISGQNITVLAIERTDLQRLFIVFGEFFGSWAPIAYESKDPHDHKNRNLFGDFIDIHVHSICVALDAEVASHEIVRAPAALNAKRAKSGKIPLSDYHVVDLARRHRIANPSGGESGAKHRLHFVRGHWRHYEESKTWIKWHLRGDPALGFIQKHYAL